MATLSETGSIRKLRAIVGSAVAEDRRIELLHEHGAGDDQRERRPPTPVERAGLAGTPRFVSAWISRRRSAERSDLLAATSRVIHPFEEKACASFRKSAMRAGDVRSGEQPLEVRRSPRSVRLPAVKSRKQPLSGYSLVDVGDIFAIAVVNQRRPPLAGAEHLFVGLAPARMRDLPD